MRGYDIATIGSLGDASPCCSSCASSSSIGDVMPETLALQRAGFLPDVVWPSDVDEYKRHLDPDYASTNAAAHACASLAAGDLQAWDRQFQAWRAFSVQVTPTFGSSNHWELAHQFEKQLLEWQNQLTSRGCQLTAPKVAPPNRDAPPDLSWVKWVAAAAIAAGVVYVASPFVTAGRKIAAR